jgi:hypothetical protein
MIGRFTTTAYDSRAAFEERRPSGVYVSHNAFTRVGLEWMWGTMAGLMRDQDGTMTDHLGSARLVVGDSSSPVTFADERLAGEQTAQAALVRPPSIAPFEEDGTQGVEILFEATFDEQVGAFDWQERGVVTAQGVLLDRSVQDQGRKVLGAVWQLEAALRIEA